MKKMISFALALIMVLVLVACGDNPASNGGNTQNETVTLRASTPTAPEHPWSKCLDNIAAQIKEKTNGRYQIDVYYNASLSENSEKTMTEQIMTGTLDLGISPAPLVGKAFSAFSFPFQFDDRDHIKRVCDSDTAKELLAATESNGLHSMAYVENGFRQITNNKHAVKTPDDMKGLKIRTPQAATTMAAITAMGANATLISNFGGVLLQMVAGSLAEYGWNYTFLAHLLGLFSLLLLVFQPEPEESCCAPTVTAEVPNGYRHSLLKSAGFDHRGRIATALTAFLLFLQQLVSYPILMNISLLFEHRHAGGATVAATALSLYSASGCLIGFFFGKIFYKLKRLTLVFGYFIAAAGAGILGFAKQTEILMIGSAIMGMTSVLLITSAYAILGMYISPNQSSLAIAIATGVSNLGGFASAYYLNMLGIITGEKLFTPIYVLMGVYTLLATAFMVYDPLLKNS